MGGFVFGVLISAFLSILIFSTWSFNYDETVNRIEKAEELCGETNIQSIQLNHKKVTCKDGRTITWSSK